MEIKNSIRLLFTDIKKPNCKNRSRCTQAFLPHFDGWVQYYFKCLCSVLPLRIVLRSPIDLYVYGLLFVFWLPSYDLHSKLDWFMVYQTIPYFDNCEVKAWSEHCQKNDAKWHQDFFLSHTVIFAYTTVLDTCLIFLRQRLSVWTRPRFYWMAKDLGLWRK